MKFLYTSPARIAGAILLFALTGNLSAQDAQPVQQLDLHAPLVDFPQNTKTYPSMQQALGWSNTFYDAGFWGIHAAGKSIFRTPSENPSPRSKFLSGAFDYAVGLAFARYGSELPVPLGVWAHEEYHRSVLGVNGIKSKNGNWLLNRWDGTVYGVSDESLSALKRDNLPGLLYSYVSGVHYENMSTRSNVIHDVYNKRTVYKNPLYLYNAWYVWNYFNFSTGAASDSVKVLAPEHEGVNPEDRDFAGADLTAWVYDMFNPTKAYSDRDDFPGGEGENRRIGYSDLSQEARDFLQRQKKLSLLNFVNPAIFCVNRIPMSDGLAFNLFFQYAPTQFGNAISLTVPVWTKKNNLLFAVHNYNNHTEPFFGIEFGLIDKPIGKQVLLSTVVHGWVQPENQDFYTLDGARGGAVDVNASIKLAGNFRAEAGVTAKTAGWLMGNPYLDKNISGRIGIAYSLAANPKKS